MYLDENRVSATSDTLMRQAPDTVILYYEEITRYLDERHGSGYAKKNPTLVGHLVQAASADFGASVLARSIDNQLTDQGLENLAEVFSCRLQNIVEALKQ